MWAPHARADASPEDCGHGRPPWAEIWRRKRAIHRMQWKLFWWFGFSILLTVGLACGAWAFAGAHGETSMAHGPGHGLVVTAGLLCLSLWGASGIIASRLTRPLAELVRVTRQIGEGNLKSRARLGRAQHGEVGELARSINEMAVRIEQQMADQRELLAAVSHEIRTPLSRIRVLLELATGEGLPEEHALALEREVVEIDDLIGDLLASSRLDFDALSWGELDAESVAREALERSSVDANAVLVVETPPHFEGDATLISRALVNLIDNARRHGRGVACLRIAEGPSRDTLLFAVEDNGDGFDASDLERNFSAFARTEPTSGRSASSLGLGLSLVRRIARAHGGRAWAENRPEGGARVCVEVHRHRTAPPESSPRTPR